MKARSRNKRFFRRLADAGADQPRPHIIELRDVHFAENELRDYIRALGLGDLFNQPMLKLLHQFEDAKNFGSLIQPCLDERTIAFAHCAIEVKDLGSQLFLRETHLKVLRVLVQAEALTQRYHVVVANPPYMGSKQMNAQLKNWCEQEDLSAAGDLFAMFIVQLGHLLLLNGYQGMITMHSWMFISQYERMRVRLIDSKTILSLLHLGPRAFDQISGERVQTAAFIFANQLPSSATGVYVRLVSGRSETEKERQFHDSSLRYSGRQSDFGRLTWKPLIYWISDTMRAAFSRGTALAQIAKPRKGFDTGSSSEKYFRYWWEPENFAIFRSGGNLKIARWVEVNKGGEFRRWYGNREQVVTFARSGESLYEIEGANIRNRKDYFKAGLTYTIVTSSPLSFRESFDSSAFYQSGGTCIAEDRNTQLSLLGLLNTELADRFVSAICPTTNSTVDDVAKFPVIIPKNWSDKGKVLVEKCCEISRNGRPHRLHRS
jgi:hypothetical protein